MTYLYAALCVLTLSLICAAGWVTLEERRQKARDRAVFFVDGPHKPPGWLRRRYRRARLDLKRALNR